MAEITCNSNAGKLLDTSPQATADRTGSQLQDRQAAQLCYASAEAAVQM